MIATAPGARGAPTFAHGSSPAWCWAGNSQCPFPYSLPALNRIPSRNSPWKCHSCSQPCLSFHGNFPSPHCSISFFFHGTVDPAAFSNSSLSNRTIPAPAPLGAVLSTGGHQGRVGHDPAGLLSRECAHTFPQPQAAQLILTPSRGWERTPMLGTRVGPSCPSAPAGKAQSHPRAAPGEDGSQIPGNCGFLQ